MRHPVHLHHRRDEALLPRLRHERDRVARAARRARRPQARAPAHPVRHERAGRRLEQEIRQVRPRRRRGDGQVPPARQSCDLRRAGAHGAGFFPAPAAGRRPGQLRLDRRRSAGGRTLHRVPSCQGRACAARRPRQGHRRVPRELRRLAEGADRAPGQVPQPAGQRLGRHRRRHGHQHSPAQPGRGDRRLHRPPRQPGNLDRRAHPDRAGAGLPDRRADPRPRRHRLGLSQGPRLHHHARQGAHRGDPQGPRGADRHRHPLPGEQARADREDRRAGAREADRGHLRHLGRIQPRRHAHRHRAEARCASPTWC